MKNPQAVLAMMADFSKAYNRVSHNTLIEILSDMGVPNWLLKIVMASLSERELILRYKGKSSGQKSFTRRNSPGNEARHVFVFNTDQLGRF